MIRMVSKIKHWSRFLSSKWQTVHLDYPVDFRPRFQPETDLGLPEIHSLLQSQWDEIEAKVDLIQSYEEDLVKIKKRSR